MISISSKGDPFLRQIFVILHWTQPGFVYSVAFVIRFSFRRGEACSQSSAGCPCAAVNSTPFHVRHQLAIFGTAYLARFGDRENQLIVDLRAKPMDETKVTVQHTNERISRDFLVPDWPMSADDWGTTSRC